MQLQEGGTGLIFFGLLFERRISTRQTKQRG
jgi:hypothetical protein